MNIATHIVCGMEVVMCKLEGGTARKLVCMVWSFVFRESRNSKFRRGILYFKHARHTGDKKNQLRLTVERFLVRSHIPLPTNPFPVTLCMFYWISGIESRYAV